MIDLKILNEQVGKLNGNEFKLFYYISNRYSYCMDNGMDKCELSYSNLIYGTGIGSYSTISKLIKSLTEKGLIYSTTTNVAGNQCSTTVFTSVCYIKCSSSTTESVALSTTESVGNINSNINKEVNEVNTYNISTLKNHQIHNGSNQKLPGGTKNVPSNSTKNVPHNKETYRGDKSDTHNKEIIKKNKELNKELLNDNTSTLSTKCENSEVEVEGCLSVDMGETEKNTTPTDEECIYRTGVDVLSYMLQNESDSLKILQYLEDNPTHSNADKIRCYWADNKEQLKMLNNILRALPLAE